MCSKLGEDRFPESSSSPQYNFQIACTCVSVYMYVYVCLLFWNIHNLFWLSILQCSLFFLLRSLVYRVYIEWVYPDWTFFFFPIMDN